MRQEEDWEGSGSETTAIWMDSGHTAKRASASAKGERTTPSSQKACSVFAIPPAELLSGGLVGADLREGQTGCCGERETKHICKKHFNHNSYHSLNSFHLSGLVLNFTCTISFVPHNQRGRFY